MKIHPVGAELFHVDGQTDRHTDLTKPFTILWTHLKTNQFMLWRTKVAVCPEINTQHITYNVGRRYYFWMLNLLVLEVTSGL